MGLTQSQQSQQSFLVPFPLLTGEACLLGADGMARGR
jgi:hypothetical protein